MNQDADPNDEKTRLHWKQQCLAGANWFYWIAGLSMVNSILSIAGISGSFVVGLGITQVFDGIALAMTEDGVGFGIKLFALFLDAIVAGVFVLIGVGAGRRIGWAFLVGMVLYALDGLLLLLLQDWLSVGFHGFALFCIYGGYAAHCRLASSGEQDPVGVEPVTP